MSCAQDLPQDLWTQILKHVPYKQRLSACALVCQKLSKAAAATQSLELLFGRSPERHDAFLGWASSYGSSLTRLDLSISSNHSSICELPCPNLLELYLWHCSVQLGASSEGVGLLHSCTALTYLNLVCPVLLDGVEDVPAAAVPAAVARVQRLQLAVRDSNSMARETVNALEARVVPHLTSLTCLRLNGHRFSLTPSKQASCFTMHSSITVSLRQLEWIYAGLLSRSTLPGIQCMTALEDLALSYCGLEPSCLLFMPTSLTRLYLKNATLQPSDSTLGASQLLQVLARLPALRMLELRNIKGRWPKQLPQYSALTASSNLQKLGASGCDIPGAAWAHVFPAGRQLPHLHNLDGRPYDDPKEFPGPGPFDSTGIAHLASCCPALETLWIVTSADASGPFHSLTALTSLRVGPVHPAAVRNDLAALSQLQSWQVSVAVPDGDTSPWRQHLAPLTALTNLTSIGCCSAVDVDSEEDEEAEAEEEETVSDCDFVVYTQAPADSPPDVWLQLLEYCARRQAEKSTSGDCMAMTAKLQEQQQQMTAQAAQLQQEHKQELVAAMTKAAAEAAELHEQLQASEGRVQQQEQQLAEQAVLLQQQEQQLAAAEGRVQALEGQLREVLAVQRQHQNVERC